MERDDIETQDVRKVSWRAELWREACELENWVDRMALRLGDAIFGEETSEKLFGPHTAH